MFRVFCAIVIFCSACSSVKTTSSDEQKNFLIDFKTKMELLKSSEEYNSSKTKLLLVKKAPTSLSIPDSFIDFFVIDVVNQKLLIQEKVDKAAVSWQSENIIKIKISPGTVTDDKDFNEKSSTYYINVLTGKKNSQIDSVINNSQQ